MDGATAQTPETGRPERARSGPSEQDAPDPNTQDDRASDNDASNNAAHADALTAKVLDSVLPAKVEDRKAARRKVGRILAYVLSIAILALALFVLTRTFLQINITDLRSAIAATSAEQIAAAMACTAVSFIALTGYDALALRQLKLHVPYPTTALASFTSYAISFTLGFPIITAGTVRYWIYSSKGLSGGKVASLTVIAGLTFWLGMVLVIGIGFLVRANGISHLDHLDPGLNRLIGAGVIAALVGYLVWTARGQRQARIQGFKLELPGFWLTVGQLLLGLIDLCAAAGCLYALLTPPRSIDYITFVAVYVFGSLLGIASNAPGGIGVFEATMLKTVPAHSQAELFAALLLFRLFYYLVPFVSALACSARTRASSAGNRCATRWAATPTTTRRATRSADTSPRRERRRRVRFGRSQPLARRLPSLVPPDEEAEQGDRNADRRAHREEDRKSEMLYGEADRPPMILPGSA